jgi:hypothetical protein
LHFFNLYAAKYKQSENFVLKATKSPKEKITGKATLAPDLS